MVVNNATLDWTGPKRLAWFKREAKSSFPLRPGPRQCPKKCNNCFRRNPDDETEQVRSLIDLKSFENMLLRKTNWFCQYQTMQYHPGQVENLKRVLESHRDQPVIYIVGANHYRDMKCIETMLNLVKLRKPDLLNNKTVEENTIIDNLNEKKSVAILIKLKSCPNGRDESRDSFGFSPNSVRKAIEIIMDSSKNQQSGLNPIIVPMAITKDHDKSAFYGLGLGSICIQILEAYPMNSYLEKLTTSCPATHLTQHLYHDISMNCIILPTHLVAFIILYLERENGVTRLDLVEYLDWLRNYSINTNMQIGFTGKSEDALEFSLSILRDYLCLIEGQYYIAKDHEKLMDYADLVIPIVAYHGLIARAILTENNCDSQFDPLLRLTEEARIEVNRDKVIEIVERLAGSIERSVACRRPCDTIENKTLEVFETMRTCGRYFAIKEPKFQPAKNMPLWAGDFEDDYDDNYYDRNKDNPAFQTRLILTQRKQKLDHLNLLMNALESFII